MHVDGFRFDLASALARELHEVDRLGAFFDIIHQDPVISQVKLIAEPWDLGEGGYQVGNFPLGWAEWNGRYRDAVRQFWKGDGGMVSELATRLAGSSDLYDHSGRRPVRQHQLRHLPRRLHAARPGQLQRASTTRPTSKSNRDGENHNHSWNCGVEGPTDDPAIRALREQQKRNLLATLFLSQGVPMIYAGDEMGRTQQGNNNAYCQDNDISWVQWDLSDEQRDLLAVRRSTWSASCKHQPVLKRRRFFQGRSIRGGDVKDITWFEPGGNEMSDAFWTSSHVRHLGVRLVGTEIDETDEHGEPIEGDTLFLMFSAHPEPIDFALPQLRAGPAMVAPPRHVAGRLVVSASSVKGANYQLAGRAVAVFRIVEPSSVRGGGRVMEPRALANRDADWYKDAVFYQLHVKSFGDSDGDGIGDFRGLTSKLDHLRDLGVDCLWLLPMYPVAVPRRRLRHRRLLQHPSELRHAGGLPRPSSTRRTRAACASSPSWCSTTRPTSTPWFQEARSSRDNPRRDWYVWSDTDDRYRGRPHHLHRHRALELGVGSGSKQYYWHRFFSHQPDLNYDNPAVREEIWNVMQFWLDLGVDGFRVDAVPYLIEREGTSCENLPETHDVLKELRAPPRRSTSPARCCWPRPTCGPRTSAPTSATATSSTWRSTSR